MSASTRPWPFVGRDRQREVVTRVLSDGDAAGVLVVGPAGVGKTRLLDEIGVWLASEGRLGNRVVGSELTRHVPFAAIAHSLPSELFAQDAPPDVVRLFVEIRSRMLPALRPGERFVTLVDDLPWLDDASLALLTQLVASGLAAVVGTVRTDHRMPPAVAAIERGHGLARVELGPLDQRETVAVLETVLDGPVEPATAQRLWSASGGNLLFLRELVHAAEESGSLRVYRGHWRLERPLQPTSRLVEALAERLENVPDDARSLCELLAVAEPLRINDLERARWDDAAMELERAGLVTSTGMRGGDLVRFAHPLYGEVLRSRMTPLQRRRRLVEAADLVSAAEQPDDLLRVAMWLLDAGSALDAPLARRAAMAARAANDFPLTARLAGAACEAGASDFAMQLLHGEALYQVGQIDEAEDALARAERLAQADPERCQLALLHHRILMWGTGEVERAIELLRVALDSMHDPLMRGLVLASIANALAFHDDPRGALGVLAEVDRLEAEVARSPLVGPLAAFARSVALTRLGDPVSAVDVAHAGRQLLAHNELDVRYAGLLDLAESFALIESGELDAAAGVVDRGLAELVSQHNPQHTVWFNLLGARLALRRGLPVSARRLFTEALGVAEEVGFGAGRRLALCGLAVCAGQLDDAHLSATLLAELALLSPDVGFLAAEEHLARAWGLRALGRSDEAAAAAVEGVRAARDTSDAMLELELVHELVRIGGDVRDVEEVTGGGVPVVSGRLAAARSRLIGALTSTPVSHEGLEEAARELEEFGAPLLAAEVLYVIAGEHDRGGQPRDAAAARVRAAALATGGEGRTPLLDVRSHRAELSVREREVADLAAAGRASKEIAQALGLSVRTVSNHLQNVYAKLGVSSRSDLAEALDGLESS